MQTPPGSDIGSVTSENSDFLLLDRYFASRAPESFLELIRRHSGLVYGTCLRITGNHQDAEELTQDCFLDLARHAVQIKTSIAGWLHQSATHRALNRLRGERRRKNREIEACNEKESADAGLLSEDASWNDIEPLVDVALSEIPEHLRTPIVMHYLEGATQSDIANTLGVHQTTVSRRLSEGLEFLRERLRKEGLVVPAAALITFFGSQSALAAPSAMSTAFGKISLAGVGTAQVAGTSQLAWLTGLLKGIVAILFLPIVGGVVWGEVVFLVLLLAAGCYLGWRRPEWFRVVCFTRQFPNIYEWPFFPFKRWTWRTPPNEWRIWMAASIVIGLELLSLAVISPFSFGLRQGSLLVMAAGLWHIIVGLRIGFRVRSCRKNALGYLPETESPVDGALLLTYASAGSLLFAKLCVMPMFISPFTIRDSFFWLLIVCCILWTTVLLFGAVLVLKRFQQWKSQRLTKPIAEHGLSSLAPPRWLLCILFVAPISLATYITFHALTQDLYPIYVPFGADVFNVARRQSFGVTLAAMDFVVLAILPLSYLYRRIPRVAWGVGFGMLGLMSIFHLGFFAKNLIAAPKLLVPPMFARPPEMEVLPDHFVFSNLKPSTLDYGGLKSSYMSKALYTNVRTVSAAMIVLRYGDQSAILEIPSVVNSRTIVNDVLVMVQISPNEFRKGIPAELSINLNITDVHGRQNQSQGVQLSIPESLTPQEWHAQFEVPDPPAERSFAFGETMTLGSVQGKPIELIVKPIR